VRDTDCWKTYDTEGRVTGVLSTWDTKFWVPEFWMLGILSTLYLAC
jgi:hypothetical protein